MTKRTSFLLLLSSCLLPVSLYGEECVPPADYKFSAYVFNERFSCKKEENKEIQCGVFGKNVQEADSGKILPCGNWQQIHVTDVIASGYSPNNPIQEANNTANQDQAKYRKRGGVVQVYKCQNQNFAMSLSFLPDIASFVVYLYHEDSDTFLQLDSKLPYDLPTNSPLIAQTTQALETYLCYNFDPKKFLNTLEAPPFSFPDRRTPQKDKKEDSTPANKPSVLSAPTKFTADTPSLAKPLAQPKQSQEDHPRNSVKADTGPAQEVPTPQKTAPAELPILQSPRTDTFRLAHVVFFPASSPVSSVRRFESADKKIELKIMFQSGNKESFLQKLQHTFAAPVASRETDCLQGASLFETIQGGSYRAFLLHPSAIVSWDEPAYTTALSNQEREVQKRRELCALNPLQFWK